MASLRCLDAEGTKICMFFSMRSWLADISCLVILNQNQRKKQIHKTSFVASVCLQLEIFVH